MQVKKKAFGFLIPAIIVVSSLQSNHGMPDDTQVNTRSVEDDALKAISYLSLFASAHEEYLAKGNAEPAIICSKCGTKILDLGEFEGGLIGIALRDLTKFQAMQLLFDDYLKILSKGIPADIIRYMVRTSNDVKQACSHCGQQGCSWQELG
jgi:hypothetical protein